MLHNDVFDSGLSVLDTLAENLYLCSQDPATFAEAQTTYKLGTKAIAAGDIAAPTDRSAGGREVVVAAITDGTVNTTETATHYALTDDSTSKLLATGVLADGGQAVTSGNVFTLSSFAIGIPDPA